MSIGQHGLTSSMAFLPSDSLMRFMGMVWYIKQFLIIFNQHSFKILCTKFYENRTKVVGIFLTKCKMAENLKLKWRSAMTRMLKYDLCALYLIKKLWAKTLNCWLTSFCLEGRAKRVKFLNYSNINKPDLEEFSA